MPRNTISYHIDSTALTIINLGYFKSVLITTQSGTSCLWWLYCSMKLNIWSDQILFKGLSLEWKYEWCVNWAVLLLTRENRSMCRKEIDSPWSWLVCFCATVMIALMFGISLNFGVLFPVLMDYFQESRERTGNFTEEPVYNFNVWWLSVHSPRCFFNKILYACSLVKISLCYFLTYPNKLASGSLSA